MIPDSVKPSLKMSFKIGSGKLVKGLPMFNRKPEALVLSPMTKQESPLLYQDLGHFQRHR
jgi:hypothetical protein